MVGSPMGICPARVKKLQISTNICGKKMASSGYQMKWTFEEALANWYADNKQQCLEKNAFRMSSCIPARGRVRDSNSVEDDAAPEKDDRELDGIYVI